MAESGDRYSPGLFTLVAVVIGNMLGAGVFTTSGFAIADLESPVLVLLAWLVGGALALCGAISYGALVKLMPVSGGEYYFLSRTVHPLAGFIAGWVSLWAGFTAAIALAAITFEAYLVPAHMRDTLPENAVATLLILLSTLAHGLHLRHGVIIQNVVVLAKLALILGFIIFLFASSEFSEWSGVVAWRNAEPSDFSISTFAMTLMWISFSYSGFNAAIYVASEVSGAASIVPRAMVIATVAITILYLLLNAIFVFATAPSAIAGQEDVAAIAVQALAGKASEAFMRGVIVVALFTSVSAMIMVGPRVYAQMANDGLMPQLLRFKGEVPRTAIIMQALLAIIVVWLTGLRELLSYLGFTLGLSSVCTVSCLFIVVRRRIMDKKQIPGYPWAPLIFIACTLVFAGLAAMTSPREMLVAILTLLSALITYWLFGRRYQRITVPSHKSEK